MSYAISEKKNGISSESNAINFYKKQAINMVYNNSCS